MTCTVNAMTDARTRLGQGIEARIAYLDAEYKQIAQTAKVSIETLAKARTGKVVGSRSLAKISRALGWPPGAAEAALGGAEVPPPDAPMHVPRDSRPEIEEGDPDLRLRDAPPLGAGESLEGWPLEDGQWHYHYRTTGPRGQPIDIRLTLDPALTLEDVAKLMRGSAAVAKTQM